MGHAIKLRVSIIGINGSGGSWIQEKVNLLTDYVEILLSQYGASGIVPQISVIF